MNSGRDDSKSCEPKARPCLLKSVVERRSITGGLSPLPYYNPRKKIKKKIVLLPPNSKVFPVKNTFLRMYAARSFFWCFVWYVSILHHMGGRNTLHSSTTQRGGGCVVAQGPRGRLPDMSSGSQEGQTKWNQKNRQKVGEEERACEHIAIGTRFAFFFFCYVFPPITATAAWNCVE